MSSKCIAEDDALLKRETELAARLLLRPLLPVDLPAIKALCAASFPIQYPGCWYDEVVSGALVSIGLFDGRQLAAMLVAETKTILHCNPEDRDIIADPGSHVVYILSLAVSNSYRRQGLASRLLRHLLETIVESPPYPKCVFLHVLSTNFAAINFYKSNGFIHHDTLLNYYRLENSFGDGCTYALYTNGARPPFTFIDVCRTISEAICFPLKALCKMFFYS